MNVVSSGWLPSFSSMATPYSFCPLPGKVDSLHRTETVPVSPDTVPISTLTLTITVPVCASNASMFVSGTFVSCARELITEAKMQPTIADTRRDDVRMDQFPLLLTIGVRKIG